MTPAPSVTPWASGLPYYIGADTPTAQTFPQIIVGALWVDTGAARIKRCTSVSPITFVLEVNTPLVIGDGGTGLTANPVMEAWISAASFKGTTTAGAGDANQLPASAETATNKVNYDYITFDPDVEQNAFFQYALPPGWNEGTITFRMAWTAPAGAGAVVFGLKAVAISDGDALDSAWGAEVTVTDTLIAAGTGHISVESGALTIGGPPAEGDLVFFNLARKVANASDTLNANARPLGIKLRFTRASYTD